MVNSDSLISNATH